MSLCVGLIVTMAQDNTKLCDFYIGLALHHRQLLDFAAKGNFIELDANVAYEILEGILGIPPQKKGFSFTPRGSSNV